MLSIQVTITHGARYTREELLLAIKNATTHPFHPVAFQKSGPNMVFYLDSREAANAVRNLNEAVKLSDSFPGCIQFISRFFLHTMNLH